MPKWTKMANNKLFGERKSDVARSASEREMSTNRKYDDAKEKRRFQNLRILESSQRGLMKLRGKIQIWKEIWRGRKTEAEKLEDKRAIDARSKRMQKRANMMNHYEIPSTVIQSIFFMKGYQNAKFDSKWRYSLHICLKVFENGSLCCIISSFYSIFQSKSLLKSVILRIKEGRFLEGGGAFQRKYGNYVGFIQDKLSHMSH